MHECGEWVWASTKGRKLHFGGDDGIKQTVESLEANEEKTFLGVFDDPEGGNVKQIEKIRDKVDTFVRRITTGRLPAYLGWMAYKYKLWASIIYGIGTMTNDIEAAETFLNVFDYRMMNVLGVASTITTGWRELHSTFGGIGLFKFVIEQMIERSNLLLQHYGTGSGLSKKLDALMAYLQLQLGVNCCPLDLNYDDWHYLAPLSWIKMLWRTLQVTGFELHLEYETTPFPRCGDRLVMDVLRGACGNDQDHLKSLAGVRGFLGAMFMSDIVTADERYIEQHVTGAGCSGLRRSSYCFPKEDPTKKNWDLWIAYLTYVTNDNFELPTPLGRWEHPTHRICEWTWNEKDDILYRRIEGGSKLYMRLNDNWAKEGATRT